MRIRFPLSLALLSAVALSGTPVLADIDGTESSATMPATSAEEGVPHSHPMIPASMPADDSMNNDSGDTDNAADNDSGDNSSANSQSDIPLVSGGVGQDDLEHLKSIQNQYDLKLLITEENGTFLSDIPVHIEDKQGRTVVDTVTDGPILLVKLPAGSYKIKATKNDQAKSIKVSVKPGTLHAYQFSFHDTDPRISGDPKTTQLK